MKIERCTALAPEWAEMRALLWPESDAAELPEILRRGAAFLARDESGAAVGFAEAALREDYVNGCESTPVAFLEGIFVRPAFRRRGIAKSLAAAVEAWARAAGVAEFASDALTENTASHAMHAALGFTETERVVFFRKVL